MSSTHQQTHDELPHKSPVAKLNNKTNLIQSKQDEQANEIKQESIVKNQNQGNNDSKKTVKKAHRKKSGNVSIKQSNFYARSVKSHKNQFYDKEELYLQDNE